MRTQEVAEETLEAKRKAVKEFDRTLLWVARTAEGLFHLAGQPELAERIRSTTRRPGRPQDDGSTGEEASADASTPEDSAPEEPGSGESESTTSS